MKRLLVMGLCLLCYATFLFAVDYMQKARCFHARAEEHRRSIALQRTTYFFCKQDERYYKRKAKKFSRRADYYTRRGKWKRVAQMNDRAEDAFAKAEQSHLKSQLARDNIGIYTIWANNMEDIAIQCYFLALAEDFEQQLNQQQTRR